MNNNQVEIIKLILEAVNTIAIVTGAILAVRGINNWKKELKGKTDYELARRFLRCVYKLRDAVKFVRNPFIPRDEIESAIKESGLGDNDISDQKKYTRAVYAKRWKKIQEAFTDLNVEQLEAEISWGDRAKTITDGLDKQVNNLFVELKMWFEADKLPDNKLIYDMGPNDEYTRDLNQTINDIEDFLRPHLK